MGDKNLARNVIAYRLTASLAAKRVRELAVQTGNIDWSRHAFDRMEEREILDVDVLRALRAGEISGEPEPGRIGEWKCKFTRQIRGGRSVGVVVIIRPDNRLLVKTVEWEDLS